jgi:hypothetical protein
MRATLAPVLLAICAIPSALAEDNKLERAKAEVHRPAAPAAAAAPKPPSGSGTTSTVSGSSYSDDGDDGFGDAVFGVIFWGVVVPVMACFSWHDDQGPAVVGVERYPYHGDWNGYFAPAGDGRRGRIFGGEAALEYGRIDEDIERYGLSARFFCSALALRTDWNRYFEPRAGGGHDTLTLGTIDLELGVPVGRHARVGLGLGSSIFHDGIGTESGLCAVVSADVFPLEPLVLNGVFTYGTVGGSGEPKTDIMTVRASLGVMWDRCEAYAGWQGTWIESVQLDGPLAGVRVWF